jgi:GNAT superfamily N-acetyltransferase
VAIDTRTGQAVGMARAMEDAYAWYSIWDVAVRPDYQSQRIGTSLIESLLSMLRDVAPKGSHVHLFTYSHSFYARMGFATDTCTKLSL